MESYESHKNKRNVPIYFTINNYSKRVSQLNEKSMCEYIR